tara:strand:- start:4 stop:270 length:267 start_codon:yes stop_codon:yes gene_type:complete
VKIILYSKENCIYCIKAKKLMDKLGLEYTEKKMEDFSSVDEMIDDIGKKVRTMPQIKIDDNLIGGYHQLIEFFDDKGLVNYKGEIIER